MSTVVRPYRICDILNLVRGTVLNLNLVSRKQS
eukprot:SAG31_NODE_11567_length_1017_cov_0.946623_2_plen_32_part_01